MAQKALRKNQLSASNIVFRERERERRREREKQRERESESESVEPKSARCLIVLDR